MALIRIPFRVLFPGFIVLAMTGFIGWSIFQAVTAGHYNSLEKVMVSNGYQSEGISRLRMSQFNEAERLLRLADLPENRIYRDRPNATARIWLRGVYVATGRYAEALKDVEEMLQIVPDGQLFLEEKKEYELLIQYRDTADAVPLIEFINEFKQNHSKDLPPVRYNPVVSVPAISRILQIYSMIGHHDEGIKLIDEVLNHAYASDHDISLFKGRFQTSAQANECVEAGQGGDGIKIDWRACKWIQRYLEVREAFAQDKAEGFKGCAGKKPGEECVGHAMRALIKSDYFPW